MKNLKITKRNGVEIAFDESRIVKAIMKAVVSASGAATPEARQVATDIAVTIKTEAEALDRPMTVEQIQDRVVDLLRQNHCREVAGAYASYRKMRADMRKAEDKQAKAIRDALTASNVQNQNANLDERTFSGRLGEATRVITKKVGLELVPKKMRVNHEENRIYLHDLDSLAVGLHNCLSCPIDDTLANGFWTRNMDVRPAKSIRTAMQLVAVIFQLQSQQQFGGISATHFDWSMVPYVNYTFRKHYLIEHLKASEAFEELELDQMTEEELDAWVDEHKAEYMSEIGLKEDDITMSDKDKLDAHLYKLAAFDTRRDVYQAVEAMYHNLNTLQSRSGGQLPFSSINYGTCTLPEGRLVTKALLDTSIKGLGKLHRTSIFPCGIFQYMKGINDKPGTPNYDLFKLALRSTAQRLYPNYANVDWSGNKGYDPKDPKTYFSTMGCRTANGYDINADPGVNPQTKDGRGNICPTTIILPTIAMEAKDDVQDGETVIEAFFRHLETAIQDARESLIWRYEWICSQPLSAAPFMWKNHMMLGFDGKDPRSAMKHGTLAIGQLGLAETLEILIGEDQTTDKGMELAKKIESLFRQRCDQFKKEDHLNFGVYYTPAENLCYTAMTKFKEKYGEIPNVSDKKFFTNSIHVPVWKEVSPFEKIDIESQLTGYSNAGCITYVEFDSGAKNNLEALEDVVRYAMEKDIPYFAINVPNDTCQECGYTDEINDACPICGSTKIMRLRRVTGYITADYKTAFNAGKQQEVELRYKHSKRITPEMLGRVETEEK